MSKKSRLFADKKHQEAGTLFNGKRYRVHTDGVANIVKNTIITYPSYVDSMQLLTYSVETADLHDTLEDTDTTFEELVSEFGEVVAKSVDNVTDIDAENREERKKLTIQRFAHFEVSVLSELIALIVKPADRYHNWYTAIKLNQKKYIKMYYREYPIFKLSVYRPDLVEKLWSDLDELDLYVRENYNFTR
jgi:GTP pyrophosphokinase